MQPKTFKWLPYIAAIYTFFFILPSILLHKIIVLPLVGAVPISILVTGTYFMILDVVTEVYGYYESRKILFAGLITYTIFVFTMESVYRIPSPSNFHAAWNTTQTQDIYKYMFSNLHLVWFSVIFCALFANSLNSIALSKWKVLTHGKYFCMRSLTTSLVAAAIYSLCSNFFAFGLFLNSSQISLFGKLTLVSLTAKMFTLFMLAYPSLLLIKILKKSENLDVYDYNLSYNPFYLQDKYKLENN